MRKKLVIIGASYLQVPLITKAKEMGLETHVFAWASGDVGEKIADYFYPISIIEKEQILEICRHIRPNGICSIASDLAATTVSYVADHLGLQCNRYADNLIQTNKAAMRAALRDAGIATPSFYIVNKETDISPLKLHYPVIVKPTDRSGSRSIWKVDQEEDLLPAIQDACASSFEECAIVEDYISGPEYSCECISENGKHFFLQLTQKYTTGAPHFIETGHCQPSDIPQAFVEGIKNEIFRALDALNVKVGASHTEFRLQPDGTIRIIEIGARMGGDCIGSDLVRLSTGYDFAKMVIQLACGEPVDYTAGGHRDFVQIKFLLTEDDIAQLKIHQEEHPEQIVRVSKIEMENLGNVTDSSMRLGYYIYCK